MKVLNFKKIDAFATPRSQGNPAACVTLDAFDDISDREMLELAKALKGFVMEVGFVARTARNRFRLRYFSSEREVDFCGHATIAIMHDLLAADATLGAAQDVCIATNRGELQVYNRIPQENAVYIMAPVPVYSPNRIAPDEICRHLRVGQDAIAGPVEIINAGLTTLLVPLDSLASVLGMAPEMAELKAFCQAHELDIVEVFTADVASPDSRFRVRVFAPTFGYLEDPATGSGNSALGYYLLQHGFWDGSGTLVLEQNGEFDRFNVVKLITHQGAAAAGPAVCFGGSGVIRIEGRYFLPT